MSHIVGGGDSFSFIDLGKDFSTSSFATLESPTSAKKVLRKKSVVGGSGRKKSLKPGSVTMSPSSSPKSRSRTLSAPHERTESPDSFNQHHENITRSRRPSTASASSIKSRASTVGGSTPKNSPKNPVRKLSIKGSPSVTPQSRKMSVTPTKTSRKLSVTPQKTSRKLSMLSVKIPSVSSETKVKTKVSTARRHTTFVGHKKH